MYYRLFWLMGKLFYKTNNSLGNDTINVMSLIQYISSSGKSQLSMNDVFKNKINKNSRINTAFQNSNALRQSRDKNKN